MLTKKDRQLLVQDFKDVFATKDDLVGLARASEIDNLNEKIESLENRIKLLQKKDEFFDRMDKLSGEIKAAREEFTLKKYNADQIEKLERRLERLEKHVGLSSTSS